MHVILVSPYFDEFDLITLFDLQTYLFEYAIDLLIDYYSPVFGRKHQVIQQYRNIMTFVYVFAHIPILSPQAAGNVP